MMLKMISGTLSIFSDAGTGNDLKDWKIWVREAKESFEPYPSDRSDNK